MAEISENSKLIIRPGSAVGLVSYQQLAEVLENAVENRDEIKLRQFIPWIKSRCGNILSKCDSTIVLDILQHCEVQESPTDHLLIKCGDRGDCFYIILEGIVSVLVNGKDDPVSKTSDKGLLIVTERCQFGKEIASLGAGQGFGEVALINADCTRTANIITDAPTKLLVINRKLYDRSIKQWQAKEFHEKYSFIYNSAFFIMLPAKQRYLVACALIKEIYKFGNPLIKQGENPHDLFFILSGQVRLSCNPTRLSQTLNTYQQERARKQYQPITASKQKPKRPLTPRSNNTTTQEVEMCLLSAYELVGGIECCLEMPSYLHTATVEQQVTCFRLSRSLFINLVRDKSIRTTAALYKLALNQNQGRIKRFPLTELNKLQSILNSEYLRICNNDHTVMRLIEQQVLERTSHTSGYGNTCYVVDTGPKIKSKNKARVSSVHWDSETAQKLAAMYQPQPAYPVFKQDGKHFLATISKKGGMSPALNAVLAQTATRYAIAGHSVQSPNRAISKYVQALSSENNSINDRIKAWNCERVIENGLRL